MALMKFRSREDMAQEDLNESVYRWADRIEEEKLQQLDRRSAAAMLRRILAGEKEMVKKRPITAKERRDEKLRSRSRARASFPCTSSFNIPKKPFGSFGRYVHASIDPRQYLRRGDLRPPVPLSKQTAEQIWIDPATLTPRVPTALEARRRRVFIVQRNFQNENRLALQRMAEQCRAFKQPTRRQVEARGRTECIARSGRYPLHLQLKYFARVPPYIDERKRELRRLEEQRRPEPEESPFVELEEEERDALLQQLEDAFDRANGEYQSLSVVVEIRSKIRRKEHLEMRLARLEEEIERIRRCERVLIVKKPPEEGRRGGDSFARRFAREINRSIG